MKVSIRHFSHFSAEGDEEELGEFHDNRLVNKDIKEYFAESIQEWRVPKKVEVDPYLKIMHNKFPACKYSWLDVKDKVHSYIKYLKKIGNKNQPTLKKKRCAKKDKNN